MGTSTGDTSETTHGFNTVLTQFQHSYTHNSSYEEQGRGEVQQPAPRLPPPVPRAAADRAQEEAGDQHGGGGGGGQHAAEQAPHPVQAGDRRHVYGEEADQDDLLEPRPGHGAGGLLARGSSLPRL